jgi:CBS domain containing-hemolysin-like protein
MDSSALLKVVLALFLVALNGFFVAAEFAIVKVRSTRIQELVDEGSYLARMAKTAISRLDAYLSATQLGITLASLGLGWIGEPAFADLIVPLFKNFGGSAAAHATSATVAFLAITFLHIVFGELAPKSFAILKPEAVSLTIAWPLHLFYRVFYPVIWLLNNVANLVIRLFGLRVASEHDNAHTEEEIRMILAASARGGSLKDSEVLLVERSFEFADTPVHAVMVPRVDIDYLSIEWDAERILEELKEHPHARYVVVEDEDLDRALGFVYLKELVPQIAAREIRLNEILRQIYIVPESQSIERLLRSLQTRHTQIALALDEYGGTAGIVTMEDLVEELVGELSDELNEEPPSVQKVGERRYRVQGSATLGDVSRMLDEELESEHFDTLAGWMMGRLERVPSEGDVAESDYYAFKVMRMDGPRVVEIEASAKPGAEPPAEEVPAQGESES